MNLPFPKCLVELGYRAAEYKPKAAANRCAIVPWVDTEIGLSYGQTTGFQATSKGTRLTGAIEDWPVIATYLNIMPTNPVSLYIALRAGLTRLSGVHAYLPSPNAGAPDTVLSAAASSYLVGGGLGFSVKFPGAVYLFVELGATWRNFPDVVWGSGAVLPSDLSPRLLVATYGLAGGMQLHIRSPS